jgi:Fe2+ or Zn2+ uptake regulation protein
MLSRATVYNTLRLFVDRGLLRELTLAPGSTVYDANMAAHHHFLDDDDGSIHDVPWTSVAVSRIDELADYEVREFSVVIRGRRRGTESPDNPKPRSQRLIHQE